MNLSELRIIVTGAGSGLGRHFCTALCRDGASVAAVDRNRDSLFRLTREVECKERLHTFCVDVTRQADIAEEVEKIISKLGWVNGLINSAGIYRDGLLVKTVNDSVIKMPLAQWQAVLDVDLTGTFLMVREVVAHMVASKIRPGIIINISSVMSRGNAGQSNYSAAKAGVVADSRVWADELADYGIRVAAISPGFIQTPILNAMSSNVLLSWIERIPMKRLGEAKEIYQAVKFVIECDYFNGKCLEVDGGLSF